MMVDLPVPVLLSILETLNINELKYPPMSETQSRFDAFSKVMLDSCINGKLGFEHKIELFSPQTIQDAINFIYSSYCQEPRKFLRLFDELNVSHTVMDIAEIAEKDYQHWKIKRLQKRNPCQLHQPKE